jgi:hypothetical protein
VKNEKEIVDTVRRVSKIHVTTIKIEKCKQKHSMNDAYHNLLLGMTHLESGGAASREE